MFKISRTTIKRLIISAIVTGIFFCICVKNIYYPPFITIYAFEKSPKSLWLPVGEDSFPGRLFQAHANNSLEFGNSEIVSIISNEAVTPWANVETHTIRDGNIKVFQITEDNSFIEIRKKNEPQTELIPLNQGQYLVLETDNSVKIAGGVYNISSEMVGNWHVDSSSSQVGIRYFNYLRTAQDTDIVAHCSHTNTFSFYKSAGNTIEINGFKECSKMNYNRLAALICLLVLVFLSTFYALANRVIQRIYLELCRHKIFWPCLTVLLAVEYAIFGPAIFGYDMIFTAVYVGGFVEEYSSTYMLLAYLLSGISHVAFQLLHIILLYWSLCNVLNLRPISRKLEIVLTIATLLFFLTPTGIMALFGHQRFFTMIWFLVAFITGVFKWRYEQPHPERSFKMPIILAILFIVTVTIRPDYATFMLPVLILLVCQKTFWKKGLLVFLICSAAGLAVYHFTLQYFGHSILPRDSYVWVSLHPRTHEYITPEAIQRTGINEHDLGNLRFYKNWIAKEIIRNPSIYANNIFSQFRSAMFDENTWGWPRNKYEPHCSHYCQAIRYGLAWYPDNAMLKKIYSEAITYVAGQRYGLTNGCFISICMMIFLLPLLYRKNDLLFVMNHGMIFRTAFTIMFAPANYEQYYFDAVVWVFLSLVTFAVLSYGRKHEDATNYVYGTKRA